MKKPILSIFSIGILLLGIMLYSGVSLAEETAGSPAGKDCLTISDDLKIQNLCVQYKGYFISIDLAYSNGLFSLENASLCENTGNCIIIDDTLSINIPCLEFSNQFYYVELAYKGNAHWNIGNVNMNEPPYFPSKATSYTMTSSTTHYRYDRYGRRIGSSGSSSVTKYITRKAVDPEGGKLNYKWEITSGNSRIKSGENSPKVAINIDKYGWSMIQLTVTDSAGHTITARYKI